MTDRRLSIAAWVTYDLANTIFALGVVGLYFPDWLTSIGQPDSALAVVEAAAGVAVIFLAPWVGAYTDARANRVPTLAVTTLLAVAATTGLAAGPVWLTLLLLGVALVAFNVGGVVYDALLVSVSTRETRGFVSGLGVGVGYLGSFIGLALGMLALDVLGMGHDGVFRLLATAFLLFALPTFFLVPESPANGGQAPGLTQVLSRIAHAWGRARRYPDMVRFLVGRFLYTDAINTLIGGFLAIFALEELGMDRSSVTALLGLAIAAAMAGAFLAGPLVGRLGPLRVLRGVLVVWMAAIAVGVLAAVSGESAIAWAIGPLGGAALGATWAADRVVMTRISPPRHLGEFYGLYATVGRFATILGPLVWALVVDVFGWGRRAAMTALIGFVAAGWWVLGRVDDAERVWDRADAISGESAPI